MKNPSALPSAPRRLPRLFGPRTVVLDLRPLQCGYAGKGIGRYTYECARRIAKLAQEEAKQKRPRYRVFSLVMEGREIPIPEIPVKIFAPAWKRPWLWDQAVLPWLLLRHRVSLLHNFTTLGPLPEVSYPMRFTRGIATVHDWHMFADDAAELDRFYRGTRRIRMQHDRLGKIKRVAVDAEQIKVDTMLRAHVNADRITVVPLGGDHLDAVEPESWLMENFVLSVGDAPTKNLPLAFEALSRLRERFIHLNWVIVGEQARVEALLCKPKDAGVPGDASASEAPPGAGATAAFVKPESLPSWISVLEKPGDGKLKACYQKALCLLFPSAREGFGIPVLEAMRLGCPVLAGDIEPLRSLIGYSPALVSLANVQDWCAAVTKLLYFPALRQTAIDSGRERAAEFTWDKTAQALVDLYLA